MKTLMLMRHAKSSWEAPELDDFDRVLNRRGRAAAPAMADWILEQELTPDLILSSSAVRAKETAELVVDRLRYQGEIRWLNELYLAPPSKILEVIEGVESRWNRLLLIAHNPGLEQLVGEIRSKFEAFPTAALACFRSEMQTWEEVSDFARWETIDVVVPRELS